MNGTKLKALGVTMSRLLNQAGIFAAALVVRHGWRVM